MSGVPPHCHQPPPLLDDSCALFLDVDGTLLQFEIDPDLVGLPAGALETIGRLSDRLGGALALVSGRPLCELDRIFFPREFNAAGMHGEQIRGRVNSQPSSRNDVLSVLRGEAHLLARNHPGVLVEDKGTNLALHWRGAPHAGSMLAQLVESYLPQLQGYRMQPGDHVIELVPADVDKGRAVRTLMENAQFKGRTPVFVGDDLTDEFGFAAVNSAGGWSVLVGDRQPSQAQYRLANPDAVHAWLRDNASLDGIAKET